MDNTVLSKTKFYLFTENKENIPKALFENLRDLSFVYGDSITDEKLYTADIIILYVTNEKWGNEVTKAIKNELTLFLKPLLVFSDQHIEKLTEIVDEEIILPVSQAILNHKIEKLLSISQKVSALIEISETASENRLRELLILRFLYTRDGYLLTPVRNITSAIGYSYPLVQLLLDVTPGKEIVPIEELGESLLLKGKMTDKIHLCPFCEHFQINFREVCPNCHSLKIDEEATIHHYRCAYVGREKEFKDGFVLRCPKCGRELRHIGVDYDKPSEGSWCNECGGNFSEPIVRCFCISCAKTFPGEDALLKQINIYSLTSEGYRAAEEGILPGFGIVDILRKVVGSYKFEVFKEFFRLEALRCKRYKYKSTLVHLSVKNFKEIVDQEGISHTKKLRDELTSVFNATFRDTDILTDLSDSENLIILTHTDIENANIGMERLKEKTASLFKKKLDFEYGLAEISEGSDNITDVLDKIRKS
ncbi:MAG: diguanylate cyclase [Proteobacteria bacterium]|nr:diguanylate cyclase [Pseudomonadota bacterium]